MATVLTSADVDGFLPVKTVPRLGPPSSHAGSCFLGWLYPFSRKERHQSLPQAVSTMLGLGPEHPRKEKGPGPGLVRMRFTI